MRCTDCDTPLPPGHGTLCGPCCESLTRPELHAAQAVVLSLAARVAAQSELLSRKAEHSADDAHPKQ